MNTLSMRARTALAIGEVCPKLTCAVNSKAEKRRSPRRGSPL